VRALFDRRGAASGGIDCPKLLQQHIIARRRRSRKRAVVETVRVSGSNSRVYGCCFLGP
jgi:hypothetical protein